MGIIFDSINHRYFKDGDEKPSVSNIISWYFNEDLSNIPPEILKAAQDRGTDIHLLVDNILSGEDFETTYAYEYKSFETLKKKHKIKADTIEQIVYGFTPNGDYCGTLDLFDNKSKILYDIKTTYEKHIEKWTAQTNLYRYALEQSGKQVKAIKIIYLPKENNTNKPEVIDLEILSNSKVEEIVKCFYLKQRPTQIVELESLPQERIKQLSLAFETINRIQSEIENMKAQIKEEMEKRGIESFKCEDFYISIYKAHKRKSFDSKKFKEDFPEIYEKYQKESEVKSCLNIDFRKSRKG
jgi:hypothetical protein